MQTNPLLNDVEAAPTVKLIPLRGEPVLLSLSPDDLTLAVRSQLPPSRHNSCRSQVVLARSSEVLFIDTKMLEQGRNHAHIISMAKPPAVIVALQWSEKQVGHFMALSDAGELMQGTRDKSTTSATVLKSLSRPSLVSFAWHDKIVARGFRDGSFDVASVATGEVKGHFARASYCDEPSAVHYLHWVDGNTLAVGATSEEEGKGRFALASLQTSSLMRVPHANVTERKNTYHTLQNKDWKVLVRGFCTHGAFITRSLSHPCRSWAAATCLTLRFYSPRRRRRMRGAWRCSRRTSFVRRSLWMRATKTPSCWAWPYRTTSPRRPRRTRSCTRRRPCCSCSPARAASCTLCL